MSVQCFNIKCRVFYQVLSAHLSESSVHILVDEGVAIDGVVVVEGVAVADARAERAQRRVPLAGAGRQQRRRRLVVVQRVRALALRHHAPVDHHHQQIGILTKEMHELCQT